MGFRRFGIGRMGKDDNVRNDANVKDYTDNANVSNDCNASDGSDDDGGVLSFQNILFLFFSSIPSGAMLMMRCL